MPNASREALRALIAERAIVAGPITLASGAVSPYYFDCRRLTLSSAGAAAVGDAVLQAIKALPDRPAAIGGMTLGADPIVTSVMMAGVQQGFPLEGFYVRKESKRHGTQQWIENAPAAGTAVVIVDDVVTSGGSILQAIERAEGAGCRIVAAIALVDREEGGAEKIRARVARFVALYTLADFPEIGRINAAGSRPFDEAQGQR